MWDSLNEIGAQLKRNKLRTALTGFAVGWGVLMLIFLLGIGTGLRNGIVSIAEKGRLSDAACNLRAWRTEKPYDGYEEGRSIYFSRDDAPALEKHFREIVHAFPVCSFYVDQVSCEGKVFNSAGQWKKVTGADPDYLTYVKPLRMREGRTLRKSDEVMRQKYIVIPSSIADGLFEKGESALGKQILCEKITATVVGVYQDEGDNIIYMPYSVVTTVFPNMEVYLNKIALVFDRKYDKKELQTIEKRIRAFFSPVKHTAPDDDDALWMNYWNQSSSESMGKLFTGLDLFLWFIGLSILSIGIVGVSNIMLVTVRERIREIGIRKALGAKGKDIVTMILTESVLITLVSGIVGFLVGVGLLFLVDWLMNTQGLGQISTDMMGGGDVLSLFKDPLISGQVGILAILTMVIAGMIAGYVPAKRAVKIPPVEAMREE